MPATPTSKPSAQLPIGSPDWQTASKREQQEREAAISRGKHREGKKNAEKEKEEIAAAIGNLPPAPANNEH